MEFQPLLFLTLVQGEKKKSEAKKENQNLNMITFSFPKHMQTWFISSSKDA